MNRQPISRRRFLGQSLTALTAGAVWGKRARAGADNPSLRGLADNRGFWIGPAAAYNPLVQEPIYGDTLAAEFNILTPENALKWAAIHPQQFRYTFDQADTIIGFALESGMAIHGHNLIWQLNNPNWLTNGNVSRDELIAIMADHIDTVAGRYAGSIVAWDVVNEAIDVAGAFRSGIWWDRLGPDYIDLAFQLAREADPNALLLYNDWGAESINPKSTSVYNMVADMLERGIPIDGVGFQMHVDTGGVNYNSFGQNMQRFADLGLALFVTEMDVRIRLPTDDNKLQQQATVYRNVLDQCLRQPACYALQMCGFTDKYSWIPGSFPGWGAALIFDEDYDPKPAYGALAGRLTA